MTKPQPRPPFLTLVNQNPGNFHPMERRVASFVIDFPGDMASRRADGAVPLGGQLARKIRVTGFRSSQSFATCFRRRPAGLREVVTQIVSSGAQVLFVADEALARRSGETWHVLCRCAAEGLHEL